MATPPAPQLTASRTVIFANGQISDLQAARASLRPGDRLIAADGGLRYFRRLDLSPHLVVGDLDSIEPAEAEYLQRAGIAVEQYPARKDETDLELAVRAACAAGSEDILIFGALGGRWDQTLANLLLLAHPEFRSVRIRLVDGEQQIYLVQGSTRIEGQPGDIVSLIPLYGDAQGVTTQGLEYPLVHGTLGFGSTLGISNVLLGTQATVTVAAGLVVCVVIGQNSGAPPAARGGPKEVQ